MVSCVPQVREEQMVRICLYVHVHCMRGSAHDVGAWSTPVVLWQLLSSSIIIIG